MFHAFSLFISFHLLALLLSLLLLVRQAAYYLKVIKNIEEKGAGYVVKEVARLSRVLSGVSERCPGSMDP